MLFNMDSSKIAKILGTVGSPLIVISELIKNAVDASAKNIDIIYDRNNREICITNDCSGFSDDDIKYLDKPGESAKKIGSNLKNEEGLFLTGSKGLGLLSVFLLCDEAEIYTANGNSLIKKIVLQKENGSVTVETINSYSDLSFTKIIMKNVSEDNIDFLSSATEIKKLRHISTFLYKNEEIPFPNITLKLGHKSVSNPVNFNCKINPPLHDVYFEYNKYNKEIVFKCISQNKLIASKQVRLNSFSSNDLNNFIMNEYGVLKPIKTRTNDTTANCDCNGVPNFEGRLLVYEGNLAGDKMKEYGAGVNIYVNDFALYNYLSEENDWLGLADFSQRKKSTRLKPHNVFGYVNFPNFNENTEQLQISNERADFIQDIVFKNLMYLLKGVVMFLIFNIDIDAKNDKPDNTSNGNFKSVNNNLEPDGKSENRFDGQKSNIEFEPNSQSQHDSSGITPLLGNLEDESQNTNKPIYKREKYLIFTQEEWVLIKNIKDRNNESQKIFDVVYELSTLDVTKYRYSFVALFRILLESATRYYDQDNGLDYSSTSLENSITATINKIKEKAGREKDRKLSKQCEIWKDKSKIVDTLNLYIHYDQPIDISHVMESWKSLKSYIIKCVS